MPRSTSYCFVCNGTWSKRKFCRRSNEFVEQGNKRMSKFGHLSKDQENYLLRFFFSEGKRKSLCHTHLKEYAKIGNNVSNRLLKESRKTANDENPCFDSKKTRKTHNRISPSVERRLMKFISMNSMFNPNSTKMQLSSEFRSWISVWRQFIKDNESMKISWTTFLRRKKLMFNHIHLYKKTKDACNIFS